MDNNTLALGDLIVSKGHQRVHLLTVLVILVSSSMNNDADLVGDVANTLHGQIAKWVNCVKRMFQ